LELQEVAKSIETLEKFISELRESEPLKTDEVQDLRSRLAGLIAQSEFYEDSSLYNLFSRVDRHISILSTNRSVLNRESRNLIVDLCDEIRLQIMTVALSTSKLTDGDAGVKVVDWTKVLETKRTAPALTIRYGYGGLTYASALNKVVILMPKVESLEQSFDLIAEFSNVYDFNHESDWVIDLSIVKHLPEMMVGMFNSYREQLKKHDKRLLLAWAPDDILAPAAMKQLVRDFGMAKYGSHWFSIG
jgi:hypothetical protein